MIRKLRLRFIILTMVSVLLVLGVIMGAINLINYRNVTRDADALLSVLSENGGVFPGMRPGGEGQPAHGEDAAAAAGQTNVGTPPVLPGNTAPDSENGSASPDDTEPAEHNDRGGFKPDGRRGMTEETPFESRWFSVTLDENGAVADTDVENIAAVDADGAAEYAAEAAGRRSSSGFIGNYRYLRTETDGEMTVLFLDCSRTLGSFASFLRTSILVAVIGLASVMFLVILFSRRIVRPMEESYAKQKRFITDAGHELKTPLTVIEADLSVLEMDTGASEWIDDIRAQTGRLAKLTNDLVFLSRMDEEQREMPMIDFPLSDVVAEMAQSFRARAIVEEKTFTSEIAPMISYHGDEKSIRELVSILLDNALKYSNEKGEIRLSLSQEARGVQLVVRNTVDRIDPEALPHLFDRFYRTDASRSSETGGYGLGLSIAKAVVTAHKGKVTATSEDGRSLVITVQL